MNNNKEDKKIVDTEILEEKDNKVKTNFNEKKSVGLNFVLLVFVFIVGSITTIALLKWTPLLDKITGSVRTTTIKQNGTKIYEKSSLSSSVDKVYDAVVMVKSYQNQQQISTGTGFVYKTDDKYGYILTNQHVVSSANKVSIIMSNDKEVEGKILGGDEYLDLAVIRISKENVTQVATIGKSEKVNLGDTVFTVGSPLGEDYRGSVTSGILSGKDRMVSVSVSNSSNNDWVMKVLQIDASINPGNSGGPLLNVNGEVIGICSMKLVDDEIEGMGFAIPIEYAMNHIDSLEKGKKIEWPLLGISMANVTDSQLLRRNGITIDENISEGVVVVEIAEKTGAADSDLKAGDVITKINDNKVKDYAHLRYELYQHQAGDTIEITFIRNGKEQTTKVKLSKTSE